MNTVLIEKVIQYALAAAGESEDWQDRDLGPIHLIKYVYLADLAHARRTGESLTGAPWRFYHFGPYCTEVWRQVAPAVAAISAEDRSFEGDHREDPVLRWRSQWPEKDKEAAGDGLPLTVKLAVEKAVRQWGSDTQGLLHYVYSTEPMLRAAPNEVLVFEATTPREKREPEPPSTIRQQKKARAKIDALQEKLAARRNSRAPRRTKPMRRPRYDDVFAEGVAWLDELAGGPPTAHSGLLEIHDSVWKSETRGDRDDT